MARYLTAEPFLPDTRDRSSLARAVQECRGCDLWQQATQAVFGEGPAPADVMLVGEQPGDREDLEGRPFVGPSGRLLDESLLEAGVDRADVYLTNAVKHFKWKPQGKRRIHQKPNWSEISACRPWVEAELAVVRPQVLVCLGATAAQALLGRDVRVTRDRGRLLESDLAPLAIATVHPSSILRVRGSNEREREHALFVADLRRAAEAAAASG
jgi:DNA polymerase